MRDTYSLYEAKAKLSALVRQVREGRPVIITVHGQPAVELRPITQRKRGMAARIADLEAQGVLVRSPGPKAPMTVGPRRAGALKRFLDSRD